MISSFIKYIITLLFKSSIGRHIIDMATHVVRNNVATTEYNKVLFKFSVPNSLSYYRVNTFSSKEPETLEWIDSFSADSVFWDIGANVGLYSIYAAKTKNIQIFSF